MSRAKPPKNFSEKFSPVKNVMVSANVGADNQLRDLNSAALGKLFNEHFTLKNSNGDLTFNLTNLEQKIVKAADAYVFLPIPTEIKQLTAPIKQNFFREMFKAASLVVGKQTRDPNLRLHSEDPESPLKPIILVNHKGCWDPFIELVEHMHKLGTFTQKPEEILKSVPTIDHAIKLLNKAHQQKVISRPRPHGHVKNKNANDYGTDRPQPDFNVCVFCSASTKNPELLSISEDLGGQIAQQGWGLISGLGRTGMMGAVVKGAADIIKKSGHGWVGGSNLPRIIEMEGLPAFFDRLWLEDDIYNRMEVMIENSQAFVIMPGGMGTVQELMTLLLLKHVKDHDDPEKPYLMRDGKFGNKPIILVNHELEDGPNKGVKFWEPLVKMAKQFGFEDDIKVVDTIDEATKILKENHKKTVSRNRVYN